MIRTFGTLALFIVTAFLPKIPWWAKLLIQIGMGALIYFLFTESEFPLPMADTLPLSSLFGGNVAKAWGDPEAGFAYLSMGVLGTMIGMLATAVTSIIGALMKKKSD